MATDLVNGVEIPLSFKDTSPSQHEPGANEPLSPEGDVKVPFGASNPDLNPESLQLNGKTTQEDLKYSDERGTIALDNTVVPFRASDHDEKLQNVAINREMEQGDSKFWFESENNALGNETGGFMASDPDASGESSSATPRMIQEECKVDVEEIQTLINIDTVKNEVQVDNFEDRNCIGENSTQINRFGKGEEVEKVDEASADGEHGEKNTQINSFEKEEKCQATHDWWGNIHGENDAENSPKNKMDLDILAQTQIFKSDPQTKIEDNLKTERDALTKIPVTDPQASVQNLPEMEWEKTMIKNTEEGLMVRESEKEEENEVKCLAYNETRESAEIWMIGETEDWMIKAAENGRETGGRNKGEAPELTETAEIKATDSLEETGNWLEETEPWWMQESTENVTRIATESEQEGERAPTVLTEEKGTTGGERRDETEDWMRETTESTGNEAEKTTGSGKTDVTEDWMGQDKQPWWMNEATEGEATEATEKAESEAEEATERGKQELTVDKAKETTESEKREETGTTEGQETAGSERERATESWMGRTTVDEVEVDGEREKDVTEAWLGDETQPWWLTETETTGDERERGDTGRERGDTGSERRDTGSEREVTGEREGTGEERNRETESTLHWNEAKENATSYRLQTDTFATENNSVSATSGETQSAMVNEATDLLTDHATSPAIESQIFATETRIENAINSEMTEETMKLETNSKGPEIFETELTKPKMEESVEAQTNGREKYAKFTKGESDLAKDDWKETGFKLNGAVDYDTKAATKFKRKSTIDIERKTETRRINHLNQTKPGLESKNKMAADVNKKMAKEEDVLKSGKTKTEEEKPSNTGFKKGTVFEKELGIMDEVPLSKLGERKLPEPEKVPGTIEEKVVLKLGKRKVSAIGSESKIIEEKEEEVIKERETEKRGILNSNTDRSKNELSEIGQRKMPTTEIDQKTTEQNLKPHETMRKEISSEKDDRGTAEKSDLGVPEDGNLLLFRISKLLNGPVHQAFVYVFSQTYTQSTNVYTYATEHMKIGQHFTPAELSALEREKRPAKHGLPMVFKILRHCCQPSLADRTSALWTTIDEVNLELGIENLLAILSDAHEKLGQLNPPSPQAFRDRVGELKLWTEKLMESGGRFDVTGRWKEPLEGILERFGDICAGRTAGDAPQELTEDVGMELRMRYQNLPQPTFNPLHQRITTTIPTSVQEGRDSGLPQEVRVRVTELVTKMRDSESSQEKKLEDAQAPRLDFKEKTNPKKSTEKPNSGIENGDLDVQTNGCDVAFPRVTLLRGGAGSGRTSLVTFLATSWARMDQEILGINEYRACVAISARALCSAEGDIIPLLLPLCSLTHGPQKVQNWLCSSPVLLIIDDAEDLNSSRSSELRELAKNSTALSILFLADSSLFKKQEDFWSDSVCLRLSLYGFDREQILEAAKDYLTQLNPKSDFKLLKKFLVKNMCRVVEVARFPRCLMQICQLFSADSKIFDEISTVTDLMWLTIWWNIERVFKILPDADQGQKKGRAWLMELGRLATKALREGRRLEGSQLEELVQVTQTIFTSGKAVELISTVLAIRGYHGGSQVDLCSRHPVQEYFLAGFYCAHQVVQGHSLHSVVGKPECLDRIAVYMGGLLPRVQRQLGGPLMELDERRLISAALNHTEYSSEDLNFLMDLVAEIKATPKLLEYIIEGTEYPDEWNINVGTVQLIPIQALLLNVSPTRIFLNVEGYKPYAELTAVVEFLWRVDIWVWLDSASQFRYGDPGRMDRMARSFFNENAVTKVDLLCGCLSLRVLKELPSRPAMTHLVYLKLRALDFDTLQTVLLMNRYLPKLLWLEVKIDFPILALEEEEVRTLPCCTAELMDVHLQGPVDTDVSKLSALLATIHNRYSGIHLHHTKLTPEGVYVLMKQLRRRGVSLYSRPDARARFRRWYYPQLSSCDPNLQLTDDVALNLLGFDDRMYYANHRIHSSCYTVAIDAWNLMTFLEEAEEIVHFNYTTENIAFIKQLDGTVTVNPLTGHADQQTEYKTPK